MVPEATKQLMVIRPSFIVPTVKTDIFDIWQSNLWPARRLVLPYGWYDDLPTRPYDYADIREPNRYPWFKWQDHNLL